MGNSQSSCICCPTSISFEYETKKNPTNTNTKLKLIKYSKNEPKEEYIILENIKEKDEKLLHTLNRIKDQFWNINENKLISLREGLKFIISKIKDKEKMEYYNNIIDKSTKYNFDLKRFKNYCDIFICIFEEKKNIKKDDIKYFLKNIETNFEGTNVLDDSFEHFYEKINEIYLDIKMNNDNNDNDSRYNNDKKNNNNNEEKEKVIEKTIISDDKLINENNSFNTFPDNKKESKLIKKYADKLMNKSDSDSKSKTIKTDCNYYKNKILKLQEENNKLKEIIKKSQKGKNEIEITYIDKRENKEIAEKIIVKGDINLEKEMEYKEIKKVKVNGKEFNFGYEENNDGPLLAETNNATIVGNPYNI